MCRWSPVDRDWWTVATQTGLSLAIGWQNISFPGLPWSNEQRTIGTIRLVNEYGVFIGVAGVEVNVDGLAQAITIAPTAKLR